MAAFTFYTGIKNPPPRGQASTVESGKGTVGVNWISKVVKDGYDVMKNEYQLFVQTIASNSEFVGHCGPPKLKPYMLECHD